MNLEKLEPQQEGAGVRKSRPSVLLLGTFDPDFYRNKSIKRSLAHKGVHVIEWNREVWGSDRFNLAMNLSIKTLVKFLKAEISLAYKVIKEARKLEVDTILVAYPGYFDLMPALLARKITNARIVYDPFISISDTIIDDRKIVTAKSLTGRMLRYLDKLMFQRSDLVFADSEGHAKYYHDVFGDASDGLNVAVLNVGANEEVFKPIWNPPPDTVRHHVVYTHSTFIPLHGIPVIIEAAQILKDRAIKFQIVGSGQQFKLVENLIAHHGLKNVDLTGKLPQGELPNLIASSSLCLGIFGTSAKAERVIPQKVFEFMASGAPILTRSSESYTKDFDGAILTCEPTPEALASAIESALSAPDHLRMLGGAGRSLFIQKYSFAPLSDRLFSLLQSEGGCHG